MRAINRAKEATIPEMLAYYMQRIDKIEQTEPNIARWVRDLNSRPNDLTLREVTLLEQNYAYDQEKRR